MTTSRMIGIFTSTSLFSKIKAQIMSYQYNMLFAVYQLFSMVAMIYIAAKYTHRKPGLTNP